MPRWPWTWPRANFPIPNPSFPHLNPGQNGNHTRMSWSTSRYNCIAWAADDPMRPWWPQSYNAYWPPSPVINANTIPAFMSAFESLGYVDCAGDYSLELGYEKIAIYAWPNGDPQHAARQLANGQWTSKLGLRYWPDIRHSLPKDVSGPLYGQPVCCMKRPRQKLSLHNSFSRLSRLAHIFIWEVSTFARWLTFGGTMYDER